MSFLVSPGVHVREIDLTKISESEDNTDLKGELACSGGSCEIKFI